MSVRPRQWDSTFFGARIFEAHVHGDSLGGAFEEAAAADAECLYLFFDAGDLAGIGTALSRGARLVDLRLEFEGRIDDGPDARSSPTRFATDADREALLPQAHGLATESRFSRDVRIPGERVRAMYEIWLDRCLDEGIVAVPDGEAAGFVGARKDGDMARIELVYVDAASRGQGLGRALLRAAVASLAPSEVRVVTQVGNVAAQRLYQALGLRSCRSLAVLHLWLDEL